MLINTPRWEFGMRPSPVNELDPGHLPTAENLVEGLQIRLVAIDDTDPDAGKAGVITARHPDIGSANATKRSG